MSWGSHRPRLARGVPEVGFPSEQQGRGRRPWCVTGAAVPLEVLVVWSFVYLALRRVLDLMVLYWRSTDAKRLRSWSCVTSWRSCAASTHNLGSSPKTAPAGGAEPPAAQAAMVHLRGHARDAASLAPPHGAPTLDLPSPTTRSATDSQLGADLDCAAGHREPTLGLPAHPRGVAAPWLPVSGSSIARVLRANGLQPAPRRTARSTTWRSFLRRQAAGIVACDFLTVDTVFLQRLTCCSSSSCTTARPPRRCHRQPTGAWVAQQARNLLAALDEQTTVVRFLIRDRDSKFTRAFDDVWRAVGAEVLLTPIQAPNANAIAERW